MESRPAVGGVALFIGFATAVLSTVYNKDILTGFSKPVLLCLFQSALSIVYLVPFLHTIKLFGRREIYKATDEDLKPKDILMLTSLWIGSRIGTTAALTLITAPTANAVGSLQTLLTILFVWLLLERADAAPVGGYRTLIVPSVLSTVGVLILVYRDPAREVSTAVPLTLHEVGKSVIGFLLALSAAVMYALYSVCTAKLFSKKRKVHHTSVAAEVAETMKLYGFMGGVTLAVSPLLLLIAHFVGFEKFETFPNDILIKLVAISLGGKVLGAVAWSVGNVLLNPVLTGVFTCLVVPGTLLFEVIFRGKRFELLYYSAMGMVFVGATWVALVSAKKKSVPLSDETMALMTNETNVA